jgi:pyroglutamyl-peptidase
MPEIPMKPAKATDAGDDRSRRMLLLVTGFGPFPGAPFNPSGPLVRKLVRLRRPALSDVRLVPHVFATSYASVDREFPELMSRYQPDAILMFGLATRSRHVRIETRARNTLSAFPDAAGHSAEMSVITQGPSSLPIRAPRMSLLAAARTCRIPARLSGDAGRYLCNYLYWRGLEAAARPGGPGIVTFIHIPNAGRRPKRSNRIGSKRRRFCQRDLARSGEAILLAVVSALNSPFCR